MPWRHWFGLTAALFLATSLDGATTHLGSALLWLIALIGLWGASRTGWTVLQLDILVLPAAAVAGVVLFWFLSPYPGAELPAVARVVMTVAVFLTLVSVGRDHCSEVLGAVVAVGCAHSFWALGQLATSARSTGGFFNPNMLAAFLAPCLAFSIQGAAADWPKFQSLPGKWKWTPTALLLAGLVATQSRSGWVAAVAVLGVMGWVLLGSTRRGRLALVGVILVAAAVGSSQVRRWTGDGDRFPYARVELWRASVQVALDHPMGVGLGAYASAMRQAGVPIDGPVRYPRKAHSAHNDLLHMWVETGWIGLLLGITAALWPLLQLRGRERRAALQEAAVWLAFAIPSAVYVTLRAPSICLLGAVWAASVTRARPPQADTVFSLKAWHLPALCVTTLVALATVPSAFAQVARTRAVEARSVGNLAEASIWAERATSAAPWTLSHQLLALSLRFQRGDMPPIEASEQLAELGERFPEDPRPFDRAARLATQHANKVNDTPEAWRLVAELRRHQAERDPHQVTAWLALRDALLRAGLPDQSNAALETALQVEPNCADAWARRAWTTREPIEARDSARKAWVAHAASRKYLGYARSVLELSEVSREKLRSLGLGPKESGHRGEDS